MAKSKDVNRGMTDIVALVPTSQVTVMPPDSGVIGSFLDNVRNIFKARAMRMNGLLKRVDETGQRMEALLRTAAERAEAAESALEQNLLKEGLLPEIPPKDPKEE
ncbi:MAG: hypothetical protein HY912_06355 [Desulfomonile tiedjei]|uniref:Uncharacterized protein n=1 Tax=Desulfomonile tiedjei TaxID=2358 RepID=A0A9D6UZE5_9BACT|nr:hypothetical protein [Desulfomonile tiedjei]